MKFIEDFVSYAQDFTGCPKPFLRWSALLCLSTIAGRKHRLLRGNWDVVPNLWVLLLGSSSSYKSTGLATARKLLREVSPDLLMGQEYSHEKLLEDLAGQPHRLFTYDEAESFFAMLNQKYNAPMKSALMSLWRDDFYQRATKKGTQTISNAYLCWGGASTPVQLARQMEGKDSDLLSGMLPRFIVVPYFGDEKTIVDPPPDNKTKRQKLISSLGSLALSGERQYEYTPRALQIKEQWFLKFQDRLSGCDSRMAPFFRKMRDEHYHKIAILSAFERGSTEIDVIDLAEVTAFLTPIETALSDVLEQITSDQWSRDSDRIKQVLKNSMVLTRNQLADKVRIRGLQLEKHLSNLKSDQLIKVEIDNGKPNRPTQVISWQG